jgi:toxin HigB-1
MIYKVVFTKQAERDLKIIPFNIILKLQMWIDAVNIQGLEATRKIPGYHDENLKGRRQGQRSIRLNKAYRAFYTEMKTKNIHMISILEVNKHEY